MSLTYRPPSRDTSEHIDRMMFAHWRSLSPPEKLALVSALCRSLHDVSTAGLRSRHPEATERELELLEARQRLGDDLFERAIAFEKSHAQSSGQ